MENTQAQNSNDFSDKVGSITVGDEKFQLCDHVQKIEGIYFATAFAKEPLKDGKNPETGIYYKKLAAVDLAFLPVSKLEEAVITYDDRNQTRDMINRLIKAINNMNSMIYTEVA